MRNKERKPYLGITDVVSGRQAKTFLREFSSNAEHAKKYRLMIGVMMSYRTLNGLRTPWSSVFPDKKDVADIFVAHPSAMNTLHYADYAGVRLAENLERAIKWCGPNLHALQLDMRWPSFEVVQEFKEKHPDIEIVLQVGRQAFSDVEDDRDQLIAKLRAYDGALDFALLDRSMGKGLGMDPYDMMKYIRAIKKSDLDIDVSIAGGLGPDTLGPLFLVQTRMGAKLGLVSCDAQGQLRHDGSAMTPIGEDRVIRYMRKHRDRFVSVTAQP